MDTIAIHRYQATLALAFVSPSPGTKGVSSSSARSQRRVYIHMCIHACIYIYVTYIYMYIYMCIYIYIYIPIPTHVENYTYTYVENYIQYITLRRWVSSFKAFWVCSKFCSHSIVGKIICSTMEVGWNGLWYPIFKQTQRCSGWLVHLSRPKLCELVSFEGTQDWH